MFVIVEIYLINCFGIAKLKLLLLLIDFILGKYFCIPYNLL